MDTFFTRLFTVILSYLHSHHPNPKKKKERKKKQIKFETLIKRFLANRGGNVRDTRRKFIFPQQLLLFVCKKRKKERKSRLSPDLSAINYGRYGMNGRWIRKKKKRKKTEEEEEQSEER